MYRKLLPTLLVATVLVLPAQGLASEGRLAGRVTSRSTPLASATVYAYHQAGEGYSRVATDGDGRFDIRGLSAGLFRIIAHKPGFLPAVVLVTRASAEISQHLELNLQPETFGDLRTGESFWELREQIPSDVLRDIEATEIDYLRQQEDLRRASTGFNTEMVASAGVADGDGSSVQMTTGKVVVDGQVGPLRIDLKGDFEKRAGAEFASDMMAATGDISAFSLALERQNADRIDLSTTNSRMRDGADGDLLPRDFEQHRVRWQKPIGQRSRSEVSAQYTSESSFYKSGLSPSDVASASRTWNVEGIWSTQWSDAFLLETGLRYREQLGFDEGGQEELEDQWLQAFGRGDWQLQPAVLVEYGLYSSLRDGTLSLVPRGGLVVRVSDDWQMGGRASYRVANDHQGWQRRGFDSALYSSEDPCEAEQESCYQVFVSRSNGDDEELHIGAVHREFSETLRLYFDENLFQHLDSVFLVEGDQLPELQVSMSRHLTPHILASLRSSVGEGGGGMLYLTDDQPYMNDVRYLIASLDTRFKATSTGLFLAFHHLEQEFEPMAEGDKVASRLDLDKLQLMLSQDLNVLADLAGEWAVQLNLELRRDKAPLDDFVLEEDPELERRLTGGIAVRF